MRIVVDSAYFVVYNIKNKTVYDCGYKTVGAGGDYRFGY
jgi:hypothetical protein